MSSSKSKDKKASPGASPFVGRTLVLRFSPGNEISAPYECLAHEGDFLHVRDAEGGEAWFNLDHVAAIRIAPATPADDGSPEALAASLVAHEAKYGPITVERRDAPQKAG